MHDDGLKKQSFIAKVASITNWNAEKWASTYIILHSVTMTLEMARILQTDDPDSGHLYSGCDYKHWSIWLLTLLEW